MSNQASYETHKNILKKYSIIQKEKITYEPDTFVKML